MRSPLSRSWLVCVLCVTTLTWCVPRAEGMKMSGIVKSTSPWEYVARFCFVPTFNSGTKKKDWEQSKDSTLKEEGSGGGRRGGGGRGGSVVGKCGGGWA